MYFVTCMKVGVLPQGLNTFVSLYDGGNSYHNSPTLNVMVITEIILSM